ncbi:hypothetical protein V9T40_006714 [Parthenolecanium corni]|uniref:Chitin-binding type-2 domain-containing protein n=1 Tax=Parthenolecanium corni TaxID=536013 RepID=A0AAN9TU28_9HEMI
MLDAKKSKKPAVSQQKEKSIATLMNRRDLGELDRLEFLKQYGPYGKQLASEEEGQDFSKIPGQAGVDYPLYHSVPETRFSCGSVPFLPGIYANVETGCQAYHICHDGREGEQGASFLCTNGTLFNQEKFTCDWWYNVNCQQATEQYRLNGDPETNPFAPKKPATSEELDPYKSAAPAKFYHAQPVVHATPSPYYQPISPVTPKYYHPASPVHY